MDETVKRDILAIIKDVLDVLRVKEEKDVFELKELSNHTIHNASIFQDGDSISIAILIYSLSKIIERKQGEVNYDNIISVLKEAYESLRKNKEEEYRVSIKRLFKWISTVDKGLKLYIEHVINQAQIKKGGKLYAHGISLGRAATILGVSQWELMGYIGKTKITDDVIGITDVKNRLTFARNLFLK